MKHIKILILLSLVILSFVFIRIAISALAEQQHNSPESGTTSHLRTIYDGLLAANHGTESAGSWGDWGIVWNRIYSAVTWTPSGNATPSDVVAGKTFFSNSRVLQTGQASPQPTPSPTTPSAGDASRINTIYKAAFTTSYGAESAGSWGNWGAMWNRIYSSALWTPSGNALPSDVVTGKTFYSGNSRAIQTGVGQTDGASCTSNSQCLSGSCTTFYQDSDGDTYGNPSSSTQRCGLTYAGYVTNNTDCYDGNASAKPGSATCSGTNRGDGSYDYNCNGTSNTCGTVYSGSWSTATFYYVRCSCTPMAVCGCSEGNPGTEYTFSGTAACGGGYACSGYSTYYFCVGKYGDTAECPQSKCTGYVATTQTCN